MAFPVLERNYALVYYTRGSILLVKQKLGSKRVEDTLEYVGLIFWKRRFETAAATAIEEGRKAVRAGFTSVAERSGLKLWQRPKGFGSLLSVEDKRGSNIINLK
ncbi:MAG: hypothetical protein NWF05_01635 [Candidatus Bathyarchaeota archaeon]|nr:hypothetical protein [Candidatus Bathyarchaeota archaeon]